MSATSSTGKRAVAKKAATKKSAPVKKVATRKAAPVKKVATKKSAPVKSAPAKAAPVKKSAAKKTVTKKAAPAKKTAAKKAALAASAPVISAEIPEIVAEPLAPITPVEESQTTAAVDTVEEVPHKVIVIEAGPEDDETPEVVVIDSKIEPESSLIEPADLLDADLDLSFMSSFANAGTAEASASAPEETSEAKKRPPVGVLIGVAAGIAAIALFAWANSNGSSDDSTPTPSTSPTSSAVPSETEMPTSTPSATATPTATATATPTPTATATATGTERAPQGVVAHYTATGATIYWTAPTAPEGLVGYRIEVAASGGAWQLLTEVPADEHSFGVTKNNSSGWTSFKVSAAYPNDEVASAKAFGLPGSFS